MTSLARFGALALWVALATGCAHRAAPPPAYGYGQQVQYGYVERIDALRAGGQTSGAGAVIGGAIGALAGHQVDHGDRKAAATVVGAIGGALIGNAIEKNNAGTQDVYRVTIRLDNGAQRSFDYAQLYELRVGDRVRIDRDQVYRYR
jgi:outer membrane lipoprotein SlyB